MWNLKFWCITGTNVDSGVKSSKMAEIFVDIPDFRAVRLLLRWQDFLDTYLINQVFSLQVD